MAISNNTTGLILAGGRATRMGGRDKGLLEIAGVPIVQRIADQLVCQTDQLVINANRHLPQYEALGYPVVSDQLEDYQGPLAGMLASMKFVDTRWILTSPCDGPFIADDYAQRMHSAAMAHDVPLCVATDGERLQPVYCLIHVALAASLQEFLDTGERKIDRWFHQQRFYEVDFSDCAEMFTNVNTPEELAAVEQLIASREN